MIAQQSITLSRSFPSHFEGQFDRILRQSGLVVECAHHGVADLDPAAERLDGRREIAVDAIDDPAADQPGQQGRYTRHRDLNERLIGGDDGGRADLCNQQRDRYDLAGEKGLSTEGFDGSPLPLR